MTVEILEKDLENEIAQFSVTKAAIAGLNNRYASLRINGIEDKAGYLAVREARLNVKNHRISVEKKRKELTAGALELQRKINAAAKEVMAALEPLENYLMNQEDDYEVEKTRIKREKELAEELRVHKRVERLLNFGFVFNGILYKAQWDDESATITLTNIKSLPDKQFDSFVDDSKFYHEAHLLRLEQAEKERAEKAAREEAERKAAAEQAAIERKAELDRITAMRKEQELESERLAEIARKQDEGYAALKAEAERIEALKLREERQPAIAEITESVNRLNESFICTKDDVKPEFTEAPEVEEIKKTMMRVNIQHCIKQGHLEEGRQYAVDCFFKHLKQVIRRESDLDDFADLYCLN